MRRYLLGNVAKVAKLPRWAGPGAQRGSTVASTRHARVQSVAAATGPIDAVCLSAAVARRRNWDRTFVHVDTVARVGA
jgi:hypothetical protein